MNYMKEGKDSSGFKTLTISGLTEDEKKAFLRIAIPGPIAIGIAM